MSHRPNRRMFASLCLTAMLLLSVVPTLGRLAGERAMHAQVPAAASTMPHTDGMSHASHMAHARPATDSRSAEEGAASTDEHFGHECPYCPLLAGLVSIDVPPKVPAALPACRPVVPDIVGSRTVSPQTSCLGSRGPPVLLIG